MPEAQHMSGTFQRPQTPRPKEMLEWQLHQGVVLRLCLHHAACQVTGIAVCNEPSRLIPADILADFYDEACWSQGSPTSRWNV